MATLPAQHEQAWILDELATLVRRRGHSAFVAAPVLEPRVEHFPEGLAEALRRLRLYAGLPAGAPGRFPATDFAEAARLVAEEYRAVHGLDDAAVPGAGEDARAEERLELTAVYLGFGVLVAASARPRLPPEALALAIAAQQVVRAPLAAERARVAAQLPVPLRAPFFAAYDALAATDLVRRLGLPRSVAWPPPRAARPEPLPTAEQAAAARATAATPAPVFRVRADRGLPYGVLGALLGVALGAFLWSWGPLVIFWGFVVCGSAGWAVGARHRRDRCSAPGCATTLPARATRCAGCGGVVSGRLRAGDEHAAARARVARRDAAGR